MSKYKFNIKKTEISETEINKHKDFKILKGKYNSAVKPLYKIRLYNIRNKKMLLPVLIISLLTFIIIPETNNKALSVKKHKEIILKVPKVFSEKDSI